MEQEKKHSAKVLIILEESFETDGHYYYSQGNWIVFALALLKFFYSGSILVPLRRVKKSSFKQKFEINDVMISDLPFYSSYFDYFIRQPTIRIHLRSKVKNLISQHDVIIVRAPSQIGPYVAQICKQLNKPLVTILVGHFINASKILKRSNVFLKLILLPIAHWLHSMQLKLIKRSTLLITYGNELKKEYEKYNDNILVSHTATIDSDNLFYRDDTCTNPNKIILLRLAAYLHNKGYESLIEVVKIVNRKGYNLFLEAYGRIYDQRYYDNLKQMADDHVMLNDAIPFGPELFTKYKESDIQIISSYSEGVPRTILEGASFCLPLISTDVGGIRTLVTHGKNCLLVESGDVVGMSDAIIEMIQNKELRSKIISNGFEMARNSTRTAVATIMANRIMNSLKKES